MIKGENAFLDCEQSCISAWHSSYDCIRIVHWQRKLATTEAPHQLIGWEHPGNLYDSIIGPRTGCCCRSISMIMGVLPVWYSRDFCVDRKCAWLSDA